MSIVDRHECEGGSARRWRLVTRLSHDDLSDDPAGARVGCGVPGLQGLVVAEGQRRLVVRRLGELRQTAHFVVRGLWNIFRTEFTNCNRQRIVVRGSCCSICGRQEFLRAACCS